MKDRTNTRHISEFRRSNFGTCFISFFKHFDPFLIYLFLCLFPVFKQNQLRTLSVCLSIYRIHKQIIHIMF